MGYLKHFSLIFFVCLFSCNSPNKQSDNSSSVPVSTTQTEAVVDIDTNDITTIRHPIIVTQPIVPFIPDSLKAPNQTDEFGRRVGKWINFYDSNWDPTEYAKAFYYRKVKYKDGIPAGKVCDFYISGYKQWEGQLLSEGETDVLEGKCIWFNSEGILEKRNNYVNGVLHGKETIYFESGKVMTDRNYSNGILNGKFIDYYLSGVVYQSGKYEEGLKTGKWRYYDTDGDYKLTEFIQYRVGAICNDGSRSSSTGRGTCSHHGGVNYWLVETGEIIIGGTGKYAVSNYNY